MTTTAKHTKFDSLVRKAQALGLEVEVKVEASEFGEFASAIISRPQWDADNMLAIIRNADRLMVTSFFSASTKRNRLGFKAWGFTSADDRTLTAQRASFTIDHMALDLDVYSNNSVAA